MTTTTKTASYKNKDIPQQVAVIMMTEVVTAISRFEGPDIPICMRQRHTMMGWKTLPGILASEDDRSFLEKN